VLRVAKKAFAPLLIAMIVLFAVLTIWALATPPVLTEKVQKQSLYRCVSYDYKVYPVESTLYPVGTDPLGPEEAPFFANLTEEVVFNATAEIIDMDQTSIPLYEASFKVEVLVRAPDQWEKSLPFEPPVEVLQAEDESIQFSSSFVLPVNQAKKVSEIIAEETDVRPRGDLNLVVQSYLYNSEEENNKALEAEYVFIIDGAMLKTDPEGELFFGDDEVTLETKTSPNYLKLLGAALDVSRSRVIFPPLLGASLIAGGYTVVDYRKKRSNLKDTFTFKYNKIKKRYGSRIIEASEIKGVVSPKALLVEVKEIKELMRISDEIERPVLQVVSKNDNKRISVQFYVAGDEAIYFFRLQS